MVKIMSIPAAITENKDGYRLVLRGLDVPNPVDREYAFNRYKQGIYNGPPVEVIVSSYCVVGAPSRRAARHALLRWAKEHRPLAGGQGVMKYIVR